MEKGAGQRPIIGVTHCRRLDDYLEAVRQAGGEPRVLETGGTGLGDLLGGIDALVLTGGADLAPELYGAATRHPTVVAAEPGRDRFEIALAAAALARGRPILAICRGVQVLNVAAGGTLIQDIPDAMGTTLSHAVNEPRDALAHEILVAPGSRLAALLAGRLSDRHACGVNSRHHQAVDRLAPGFQVSATAPDGIIEAIERPGGSFCLGVQWHPENFWRTGEFAPLFERLIANCARSRKD
jgi:putative glutamine amidotransferase